MAATLAGVDADRQAELFRCGIDRKEVWVVKGQRADDAAEKNADGAVLLRIVHLLNGCFDRSERQHGDPAKPAVGLMKHLAEKFVVRAAERRLELRIVGYVDEKQGRVDD